MIAVKETRRFGNWMSPRAAERGKGRCERMEELLQRRPRSILERIMLAQETRDEFVL
jgi:hypothetical protein